MLGGRQPATARHAVGERLRGRLKLFGFQDHMRTMVAKVFKLQAPTLNGGGCPCQASHSNLPSAATLVDLTFFISRVTLLHCCQANYSSPGRRLWHIDGEDARIRYPQNGEASISIQWLSSLGMRA